MPDCSNSAAPACAEVQAALSDLLDLRSGSSHPPEGPLSAPEAYAAYMDHLERCAECRSELESLSEVGALYAEFSVGELPAQAFETMGARVRQRMAAEAGVRPVLRLADAPAAAVPARPRGWMPVFATAAAAAALALVATLFVADSQNGGSQEPAVVQAGATSANPGPMPKRFESSRPVRPLANVPLATTPAMPVTLMVPRGPQMVNQTVDPSALPGPDEFMRMLEREFERQRYVGVGECAKARPSGEAVCLLGAVFRIQREAEAAAKSPQGIEVWDVYPGSPADQAGLHRGDRILGLNDLKFEQSSPCEVIKLLNALEKLGAGELVELDFARREAGNGPEAGQWSWQKSLIELSK